MPEYIICHHIYFLSNESIRYFFNNLSVFLTKKEKELTYTGYYR